MRSLSFVLLAALGASVTRLANLKEKYGDSISETFRVRPNIGVMIRHAQDGKLLEMLVVPLEPDSLMESRQMTITQQAAKSVIDELVPESSRGKYIHMTFLNETCLPEDDCVGLSEDYENVYITYNWAREKGKVRYADVRFKT